MDLAAVQREMMSKLKKLNLLEAEGAAGAAGAASAAPSTPSTPSNPSTSSEQDEQGVRGGGGLPPSPPPPLLSSCVGGEAHYTLDDLKTRATRAYNCNTADGWKGFYSYLMHMYVPAIEHREGVMNLIMRFLNQDVFFDADYVPQGYNDKGDALIELVCEFAVSFDQGVYQQLATDQHYITLHSFLYKCVGIPCDRGLPYIIMQWFKNRGYITYKSSCSDTGLGALRHPSFQKRFRWTNYPLVADGGNYMPVLLQRLDAKGIQSTYKEYASELYVTNYAAQPAVMTIKLPTGFQERHTIPSKKRTVIPTQLFYGGFTKVVAWSVSGPVRVDLCLTFNTSVFPRADAFLKQFYQWSVDASKYKFSDLFQPHTQDAYDVAHGGGETIVP